MRAVVVATHGDAEVMQESELPDPVPGPGELLVRNRAIGVNFVDAQHRRGAPYPVELPLVPGTEAAGVVVAAGDGVDPEYVGRKVVHFGHLRGVYAELTAVPARFVVTLPDDADLEVAAAVAMSGTTAHVLTRVAVPVSDRDVVLVHSASGSAGAAVVQLAAAAGARVIAAASTQERADLALDLGARHAVTADDRLARRVKELTDGRGADVVYDANGGPTFVASLDSLATGGTLVLYGQSGGPVAPFDPGRLSGLTAGGSAGSLGLRWVAASHYLDAPEARAAALGAVLADVDAGRLQPRIGHRLPLAAAADAHRLLEQRRANGKILLLP